MNLRVSLPGISLFGLSLFLILAACGGGDPADSNTPDTGQQSKTAVLDSYLSARQGEFDQIDAAHRTELDGLADLITTMAGKQDKVRITFVCTHNSRRSHLGAIWAQVAADRHGFAGVVETFSGGTEATAFNSRAVAAVQRAGLDVKTAQPGDNPTYAVRAHEEAEPMLCWSKTYDDPLNPQQGFIAVLVCSDADAACPVVRGAAHRVAIPYVDPKAADGTEQEAATYDERCAQIAREMLYVFTRAESKRG